MTEPGELSFEGQEVLNRNKVDLRRDDAMYMRDHPELTLLVNCFLRTVLEESPEDPLTFAQDFFTQRNLQKRILRIDDDGDSSSSGEDIELEGDAEEKERRRMRLQSVMKEKRKQVARRARRAKEAKPVLDLECDSETDEEDEHSITHDSSYGLGEERVSQLMKLFNLVDKDRKGFIDSYELGVFATSFFRQLKDPILRREAEEMMEEIDIDKNGHIDREEYLAYFSLCVGLMEDADFLPIYLDLLESFEAQAEDAESEADMIPGERLVKLQMLFQGWDPRNTGTVPRDIVFVLARACEPYTQKDPTELIDKIPEVVARKDFITACLQIGLHSVAGNQFDDVIDPLLAKAAESQQNN